MKNNVKNCLQIYCNFSYIFWFKKYYIQYKYCYTIYMRKGGTIRNTYQIIYYKKKSTSKLSQSAACHCIQKCLYIVYISMCKELEVKVYSNMFQL